MSSRVAKRAADAFDSRVEQLRRCFHEIDPSRRDELAGLRRDLEALQADFEAAELRSLSEVLVRVGLLTEVWECVAAESAPSAKEVVGFCELALEHLAEASPEDVAQGSLGWILQESEERWSQYLGLLDEGLSKVPTESESDVVDEEPLPFEDEPAAIDPANLLRMLIGTAPTDSPAPPRAPTPPRPRASREPESKPMFIPASPIIEDARPASPPPASPNPLAAFPAPPAHVDLDPDLREAFLAESTDLFERIETLVLDLGRQGNQAETLHELGRCYHTLKGAAGSVGLLELASLVHSLEERLDGHPQVATPEMIDLFHGGLRYLEGILEALRKGSAPAPARPAPAAPPTRAPDRPAPVAPAPVSSGPPARDSAPVDDALPAARAAAAEGPLRVPSARVDDLMDLVSELITRRGLWMVQADAMKDFGAQAKACRSRLLGAIERFHDLGLSREEAASAGSTRDSKADVPWLVRRLAEQAEDLAVLSDTAQAATIAMADHRDSIDRLTLQLWESLQAIRITPVRGLFQRLARVAHDAARVEGRQVEVVMVGEESGLDRAVQDKAFEPMLHMVRNAVGHGIEGPADRVKAGKSPSGRVTLTARREGNTLVLSVADDGRGLDYVAIETKARRVGLIGRDETPNLNRLNGVVFQAGFSTREEANSISGRGVGMDVVAQEVARLHGTIDLASQPGFGTTMTVRLPVRLALERVMIVRIDDQAFALPVALVDLAQAFDPAEQEGWGGDATVRVRGRNVPLVDAREALGFSTTPPTSNPKLLLVQADDDSLALLVDSIEGTRELVLRPLGPLLAGHPVISGTGLSVNGEAILALNPTGMARWLRAGAHPSQAPNRKGAVRQAPILVVDDSISVRRVVTRNLRALGYEVEEVSHGLEALGKVRNHTYSMILTDLEMPQLDGFELLAELGRSRSLETLPVVVASTKSDPNTRRRILDLGARAFLTKPVEPEELARVIRPLLENAAATPVSSISP